MFKTISYLNIENVWLRIKRALQPIGGNISTQSELIAEIRRVWESLPVNYIQGLYQTIPTRIREVIRIMIYSQWTQVFVILTS
jgi:hypothetical protein